MHFTIIVSIVLIVTVIMCCLYVAKCNDVDKQGNVIQNSVCHKSRMLVMFVMDTIFSLGHP